MSEPLSLQELGRVLLRNWLAVALISALGGVAAIGSSYALKPVYTASATQLVKGIPGRGTSGYYEAAQFALNRARSYPSFVYSSTVLEGVRSDMRNTESVVDLRKDLSATNPTDTPLVVVTAVGSTPTEARDKANSAARHMARFITQIETVAGTSPIAVETPVEAPLPTATTSPKRILMGAVGVLIGFALGTVVALLRNQRLGRPRSRRDATATSEGWWSDAPEGVNAAGTGPVVGQPRDEQVHAELIGSRSTREGRRGVNGRSGSRLTSGSAEGGRASEL